MVIFGADPGDVGCLSPWSVDVKSTKGYLGFRTETVYAVEEFTPANRSFCFEMIAGIQVVTRVSMAVSSECLL